MDCHSHEVVLMRLSPSWGLVTRRILLAQGATPQEIVYYRMSMCRVEKGSGGDAVAEEKGSHGWCSHSLLDAPEFREGRLDPRVHWRTTT